MESNPKKSRKFIDFGYIHLEKRRVLVLACILFWSVLLGVILNQWVLGSVTIQGDSMDPTFKSGSRHFFHRWAHYLKKPERGEIVVVRDPFDSVHTIKRVVGLPDERIQIKDGVVFIDEKKLDEPYLPPGRETKAGVLGEKVYQIGGEHYFVLGDNRDVSHDSRIMGAVSWRNILGKVNPPAEFQQNE